MSETPRDGPRQGHAGGALATIAVMLVIVNMAFSAAALMPSSRPALRASDTALRLDPNTASLDELALLPRIGPTLARNIVAYRESVGDGPAFRCAADLDRVARIGPATVEAMSRHLRFAEDPVAEARPRGSP